MSGKAELKPKRRTPKEFFRKYFLEGQELDERHIEDLKNLPENAPFDKKIFVKYRKFIAFLIPFSIAQTVWWLTALRHDFLPLYRYNWEMPLTMILGATVAGMTSEGGGAVAFPVMTFVLKIDPITARDFSIMIQTVGMSTALFVIVFMQIQIEWRAIIMGTLGAIPGFLIGLYCLDPLFTPAVKKMMFVSIWCSFAISLWILNRQKKRPTNTAVQNYCLWKAFVLMLTGFVGGIFNSFAGSGVDICVFSILTLLFRVSEKTATPTTVVLMGINSQIGFFWRAVMDGDIDPLAWDALTVCAPVVVTFAPLGSFLGSHFHRLILANFIYFIEILALAGFLFTNPHWTLIVAAGFIICFGLVFFTLLSRVGQQLVKGENMRKITNDEIEEFIAVTSIPDDGTMNLVGLFGTLFAALLVCAHSFILQELPLERSERTMRTVGSLRNHKLFQSPRGFRDFIRFRNAKRFDYQYVELPEYPSSSR